MTALVPGTAAYEQVFGGADLSGDFIASGITYQNIRNDFNNPAYAVAFSDPEVMHASQTRDVRSGLRFMVRDLAVSFGDDKDINVPSVMLAGIGQVIKSAEVDISLPDLGVGKVFSAVQGGNPAQIAGAVLGVAMGAIGIAIPAVGLIGAAIVGLATGIAAIFNARDKAEAKNKAEEKARLYRSFPPMQLPNAPFDGQVVQALLRPKLRTRDWTAIYLPQFEADTWVGIEREGGYAFAPGKTGSGNDLFDDPTEVFSIGAGLGVMPGSDRLTSVIQVNLTHDPNADDNQAWTAFAKGGKDPRGISADGVKGWTRVHDTGMYLPATARLAASLWEMATADSATSEGMTTAERQRLKTQGNPLRYRLDTLRMHAAWKRWAEGGLRYIREVCYPWTAKWIRGDGSVDPDANLEGFFGTGIYDAVGAWCCLTRGGSSTKPNYDFYSRPYGILGPELAASPDAYGRPNSSVSSLYSGSFLPIHTGSWPDKCMGDAYHRGEVPGVRPCLKTILDSLRKAQVFELKYTLVSAYCSERDAAFAGDPKLLDLLRAMRARLLTSEDRFALDLADVTEAEPALPGKPGKTWRQQLLAAGVPLVAPAVGVKNLRITPPGGSPPPRRPGFVPTPPNPWEPTPPPKRVGRIPKKKSSGALVGAATGVVALGAAVAAVMTARKKPRRSFSAGRLPEAL